MLIGRQLVYNFLLTRLFLQNGVDFISGVIDFLNLTHENNVYNIRTFW